MIKNTLPDKSGNLESLKKKKKSQQFESFSANVSMVGKDFLRAFTGCFVYNFVIQMISEKTLSRTGFTSNLRDIFT